MPPTVETWAEDSIRLLLTKNPACSCNCLWCQDHGISFERLPRPWQTVGSRAPPMLLTTAQPFLKGQGPLPWLRCRWSAYTDTSDEQTRPGSEPLTSARGVIHLGPVRHEWLYRIAPRITDIHKPYHNDNVGTQSAGNT